MCIHLRRFHLYGYSMEVFFTLFVSNRTKYRVIMNQADNECGSRAVDSFINYETVKVFFWYNFISILTTKNLNQKNMTRSLKYMKTLPKKQFSRFQLSISDKALLSHLD
uniref:ABC transporter B family member 23, mitochondrial (Trinotate prediction) n=1 Tax=Myxobolus squamalis TaxID=59785 RepID=A0A6B2FYR0_MYXSQ